MISYQVAAGQITWARKEHNLFFNLYATFICTFYIFLSFFLKYKTSEEGKSQKASGKQIIRTVND